MMSILGIGLDAELKNSLSNMDSLEEEVICLDHLEQASPLFESEDVSLILVDSHATNHLKEDMNQLLGETPLTTKIILITHPSDMLSSEAYTALGITTLDSPVSSETLDQVIS